MAPLTSPGSTAAQRARQLAGELARRGLLSTPRWREALEQVPRHLFAPQAGWALLDTAGGAGRRIDAAADPRGWWDAVYSDSAIVIQADDGAGDPASGEGACSSSVSAPGVVAEFLELLAARPGDRVLEIGTGSGWTAAMLCHTCGDDHVTSIEVDPALAARAEAAITRAGYRPRLLAGDGAAGDPAGAPYDRVHVTCAVADVPRAWISQTRPGGLIVLPWSPSGPTGYKVRLTVVDSLTAVGSFHGQATYMMLRAQRQPSAWSPHHTSQATATVTGLDPRLIAEASDGARLAITAQVPGVGWHTVCDSGATSLLLYEASDPGGSWAACDHTPGAAEFSVTQFGPRRLWDETAAAHLSWLRAGSPGRDRYRVTVGAAGTRIWVDNPANVVGELRPPALGVLAAAGGGWLGGVAEHPLATTWHCPG